MDTAIWEVVRVGGPVLVAVVVVFYLIYTLGLRFYEKVISPLFATIHGITSNCHNAASANERAANSNERAATATAAAVSAITEAVKDLEKQVDRMRRRTE